MSAWADSHFGLISRRELLALGVSEDQIDGWLAAGWLRPAAQDAYFVGHRSGVPEQRGGAAARRRAGRRVVVRLDRRHGRLARTRAPDRATGAATRDADVARHSDRHDPREVIVVRGLPCVIPARAVMDLPADRLRQALQWLMTARIAIEPIVERMRGRRGARAFRDEVAQLIPQLAHAMSELEARLIRLSKRYGIPLPVVDGLLAGGDLIDCSWPDSRVVVELDGRRWHEARDREDRARDHRRLLEGRVPLRFGWTDVDRDHAQTADKLRRGLAMW